jgi:trigger factor
VRVEVERLPQSQVQLQIEIDPEMLGHAVDKAYQRLAGRYRVPGFRPGKAPRAVLERAIGPETVLSEAAEICMNDAYAQAIKEHDLQPIGYPDVQSPKAEEIHPDQPLSFTAMVYVRPNATLGEYRSLQLPFAPPEVTEADVDELLERYREQQAPWQSLAATPADYGDLAVLRVLATVGEETLVDQDSWEYRLNADEPPHLPIPGLAAQVVGMTAGESKDVRIDLGEDYIPAEHAGKQMQLHLELLRLDRRQLPALDDEFAKSLGAFETLAQLREMLGRSLRQQRQEQALNSHIEEVVRRVVEISSVDVPPPLVDQEVDDMMRRLQENVEQQRRITMDTYTRIIGKTLEELRQEARPAAEESVRRDLVLDAVAEAEEIAVPDAEVDEQVRLVASATTLSTKERRRLLASEDLRQRIRRRLRRQYAVSRLMELIGPLEQQAPETPPVQEAVAETGAGAAEDPVAVAAAAVEGTGEAADGPLAQQNEQES